MYENIKNDLSPKEKIDILFKLFKGENISELIDKLDNSAVVGMQYFLWETAAEFGIICRGKEFSRKEITRKMTPTSKYQQQQGCSERTYSCKGTYCIHTNPDCARKKIKEHVNIIAQAIHQYISIEQQNESF